MTATPSDVKPGGFLQHHDDEGFLDALQLLITSNRVKTADDLVRYAEQAREGSAAEFLRHMASDGLPVQLMFDALSVHIRIVAHKRNNRLLQACNNKQVGLVLPLPPHVLEAFLGQAHVSVFVPDGYALPPSLRGRQLNECKGTRACRNKAPQMEVLVFEAHREGNDYAVDPAVSDVVDLRIVPATTQLLVHVRPHANPDDLPLTPGAHTLNLL
jgi:hypothetical protein